MYPRQAVCYQAESLHIGWSFSLRFHIIRQSKTSTRSESRSPSRMPERTGLPVGSSRENVVSPCLRGARNLTRYGAVRAVWKSALMRPKGSDSREGLHPDKGLNRALVRDGKGRANPGDVGSIPLVFPIRSQAQEQGSLPPSINDRFRYAETWRGLIPALRTLNAPAKHNSLHKD